MRIVTHPAIVESPLAPEAAISDIDDLLRRPRIVVVGEGDRFWETLNRIARSRIHDLEWRP